ncbi:hypothetical protein BV22DRAFT_1118837 [Leucogyrophana mollusca]|uniref:Uncharacterized protein n=1 Tax=Leucogyrophana mollusca TaxID=85980 RepID=A0ACB8BN20_9AGAM|nr:hypothetical protein BV22DRAFT_1118837 [Leucogyrophana mollusca]
MEKVREEWTPRTITSDFQISARDAQFPLISGACGLGWRYGVDVEEMVIPKKSSGRGKKPVRSGRPSQLHHDTCYSLWIEPFTTTRVLDGITVDVEAIIRHGSTQLSPMLGGGGPPVPDTLHWQAKLQGRGPAGVLKAVSDEVRLPGTCLVSFNITIPTSPPSSRFSFLSASVANPALATSAIIEYPLPVSLVTLAQSICSGAFFDTKFIAFSRQLTPTTLATPLPIFANSAFMRGVTPNLTLEDAFGQPTFIKDLGHHIQCEGESHDVLEGYEYDCDSDLDEDESLAGRTPPLSETDVKYETSVMLAGPEDIIEEHTHPVDPSTSFPVDSKGALEEDMKGDSDSAGSPGGAEDGESSIVLGCTQNESECRPAGRATAESMIISEGEEWLTRGTPQRHIGNGTESGLTDAAQPTDAVKPSTESTDQLLRSVHVGHTVLVTGAAYKTWHALTYYCYTGQVTFSPIKSQNSLPRPAVVGGPPPCSPKSMYRLADKLKVDALKDAAFDAIRARLSEKNILEEVLSKFTSKYPAIQEMEVALLVEHCNAPEILQALPAQVDRMVRGEMPHSGRVLVYVLQHLLQRAKNFGRDHPMDHNI